MGWYIRADALEDLRKSWKYYAFCLSNRSTLGQRGLIPESDIIREGEGYYEVKISWEQIRRYALDMKGILAIDATIIVATVWYFLY